MVNYICSRCNKTFEKKFNYQRHLKRQKPCSAIDSITTHVKKLNSPTLHDHLITTNRVMDSQFDHEIQILKKQLVDKDQQIKKLTEVLGETPIDPLFIENQGGGAMVGLPQKIQKMEEQIIQNKTEIQNLKYEVKEKSTINNINNNLNIVCVGSNDNYFDMLIQQWNNFDKALEYIKDCALSNLTGDCKLIEKIYFDKDDKPNNIYYTDKSRTKIEYFNEKREKIIDKKESFGRKLANNLQNSYLKGVNYLLNKNLDNRLCPNKFLEEYDIQLWNHHIYNLSDSHYQKKIINNLNIPLK